MYLFLLLLFPGCLAIWILSKEGPKSVCLFNAFLGFILAAFFCAFKFFFAPFYFLTPDSFIRNFIHIFLEQILLPLGVLTAAFFFVFKKDKVLERVQKIFPLYAGFYAVYLPFRILNDSLPYSAYGLFAKPILFLLMLLLLNKCQNFLFVAAQRALLTPKQALLFWFAFALGLLLPAVIESLWILGMNAFFTVFCVLIYSVGTVFCLTKDYLAEKGVLK